jgi:cytochrome P450
VHTIFLGFCCLNLHHTSEQNIQILGYLGFKFFIVYTKNMKFNDMPALYMFLKKVSIGNPLIKSNSENVFFAFTSKSVEDVLLNKYSSFIKDGLVSRLKKVLGNGIMTIEEPEHMVNKKEMYPAFSNNIMEEYEKKVASAADYVVSSWSGKINVRKEMKFLVFKSILDIFFSENMDEDFVKISDNATITADKIAYNQNDEELSRSTEILKEFCKKIVDKRIASKENKNDFLGMLINSHNSKKITIDEVYDQAITIFLTSYKSTSHVLEWAIYYLSSNPDWQEKIYEKENLEAFIKEVLRLCPPIWNTQHIATEDVTVDGTFLAAGTKVTTSPYVMHRDKDVFEDPDSFKPERWLDNKELSKGEYYPFLFGKRQCIGKEFALMEIRVVLTKIIKMYKIELIDGSDLYTAALVYKPKEETIISVTNKFENGV